MTDANILNNMTFSYSSVNTYQTCPLCFKLTYLDRLERAENVFAQIGTAVHQTMEQYFKGNIDLFEMSQYYKSIYPKVVISDWPPYPRGMEKNYIDFTSKFFDNFEFDKDDYDIIFIEDKIDAEIDGFKLVVKPDLVLHHRQKDINILLDYKTSNFHTQTGKLDEKKIDGYRKQLVLYSHFITEKTGIKINKIMLWSIRLSKLEELKYNKEVIDNTLSWFKDTVKKIKDDTEWAAKPDKFFCEQICSMRPFCKYGKG